MAKKSSRISKSLPRKRVPVRDGTGVETPFAKKVYAIVAQIPRGQTRTYGQVAAAAGRPGAARAVGTMMSKNRHPHVPCHRVIRSDGKIGGYAFGGSARKRALLKEEGAL